MGEAAAFVIATFAQAERKRIGERTREGLAVKRSEGVRPGRPRSLPATTAPRIKRLHGAGKSLSEIARRLNADGVANRHSFSRSLWAISSCALVCLSCRSSTVRARR